MDKKTKQALFVTICGVVVFVALTNLNVIGYFLGRIWNLFLPVIAGGILAFFLNVPMRTIDKGIKFLFRKSKHKLSDRLCNVISLILTLLCIALIILLVITLLIPEIILSVKTIYNLIQVNAPKWIEIVSSYNIDTTWITQQLAEMDYNKLLEGFTNGAGNILNVVIGAATSTVNVFITGLFALIISMYILLDKKKLYIQTKKLIYAYVKSDIADRIYKIAGLVNSVFSKFLSGQCTEAVILGVLMFIAFSIFRLPYASLIAVLTTVLAFIPYIGSFVSCFIGTLLTLMVSPVQAVICIIVYQVVQFIENQFIYPRVVGGSIGLAPMWTLIAALLGGNLFGVFGMIFFIPLVAVIYILLKENTGKRIKEKKIKID